MQGAHEAPRWAYRLWRLGAGARGAAGDAFGPPPAAPPRRVVITGVGLVTPLAVGAARSWARLLAGHTAVRALAPEDLPEEHRGAFEALPSKVVACVPQAELDAAVWAPPEDARGTPRFVRYALTAAAEALADAGWAPADAAAAARAAVAVGAGMGSTGDWGAAGAALAAGRLRRLSPFFVPRVLPNAAAGAVSLAHGFRGPSLAPSTACAAGAHALADAFHAIRRGDADVALAGGAEACVDALALAGFGRLRALSTAYNDDPAAASRPFDAMRDGFVLGEGAGVLFLEELEGARARGARVYAEIRGAGLSGDAHHPTAPPPDGAGAAAAMRAALRAAGLTAAQVCHVNAHATSTPAGDAAEAAAIAAVFGAARVAAPGALAVSATKGAVGHLLGAAGAVEAAFTVLALLHGAAPPTANLAAPEARLAASLVRGGPAALPPGPRAALTNSFGFGGTNACLALATME
jgi:3-oxoacyl-[acyl-carrier-protein] synthase II